MIFTYNGTLYPGYLKEGNAISYIMPVAKYFCKGKGLDIGGTTKWHFPGARIVNVTKNDKYDANCLPKGKYDYIISSHCLEHLEDPYATLHYWKQHLEQNGVLFLYLPHPKQSYWLMDCPHHKQKLFPELIKEFFIKLNFKDILVSDCDMYWSFCAIGFNK